MSAFEDDLKHLKAKLLKMGAMVEDAIRNSIFALIERDDESARRVIANDRIINRLDVEIDEESIRLLALRQPMAKDLRLITTAMKITTDIERMGDLAVNIAERALELNIEPPLKSYMEIPRMKDLAQGMTRDALDAFVRMDKRLASDVIMRDDEVDELKHEALRDLAYVMAQDPANVTGAMKLSFIAQYLERLADHATNISEMVIYLVEGKIIRHTILTP